MTCPFCGSSKARVEPLENVPGYVKCNECGGQGPVDRSDYYRWICDFAKILGHPIGERQ